MIRLASVIQRFESAFLEQYRHRLRPEHLHALAAIKLCRSQASPKMLTACTQCEHQTLVPHSCGHRHCPHCQHHESQQWIERQLARLVPAEYFLITFTLPAQLRPLARTHPRSVYDLMLRCAWDTVRIFSHNDRHLRGMPGAIAVLHTHTRTHEFHPHAHLVLSLTLFRDWPACLCRIVCPGLGHTRSSNVSAGAWGSSGLDDRDVRLAS